ncbi:malto-oligosyltrehalose trehalohydrolase [Spirosoma radiotolerans]|uniref:Malto-oligosyltrehalose trehalohydrolase n=1 Tax=Spirosoma radiotolerans TaxID=1379870 RepID=A0A0E3ZUZ1_9BACT|nr:malto-oligosyltrehalose trehalohydrolase [Spirosoma radiotolerans]AKD54809.1 malto-oligosyltrehalose trehalohydrolase [Spirosoma radiotolerans]
MTHLVNSSQRSLGVTFPTENQANIVLWAPLAKHVAIKVYGNQAAIPLKKEDLGYWCLTTSQLKPGDLYTYILDGHQEYPDPTSLSQPQGVHGPSQAVDTGTFQWEDQCWVNPALDSYLLYELHTGTFTQEGTFQALESKLDYLKALGVNAIEIMPVAQFSDSRNWGYDGVYTYAVQSSYGGAAGLQHLINACHYKGIAVVLDVVYNHFGPEGNYVGEFGPYLTDKYCTPWGKAVNFDDAWCDGVRRYVIENALMWFRDFHIDALRLDAVHAIKDFSPKHILQELREEVDKLMAETGRRHYLIVESDLNDPRFINPLSENGYGMDAQWMDEFHHALRVSIGEEPLGYYADFEGIGDLAKAYQNAYVYDGQFSEVRHKLFGYRAETNPGQQFIVFSQNHDQIGNRKLGERSSQLYSYEAVKLMAGAVFVSPYIPLLFMGEEWGETDPFYYFVSHSEPELVEAVRKGRKEEFAAFHSDEEVPDPESDETYERAKLQWDLLEQESHQILLRYYQTLIALRQQLPALAHLERRQLDVRADEANETLILHRWHEDQHVLCLMNFSDQPQSISLPEAGEAGVPWRKLLDSADSTWQPQPQSETGPAPEAVSASETIQANPESIIIYAQHHEKSRFHVPDPISPRLYLS